VTFNIDIMRSDFIEDNLILRMLEVPGALSFVPFFEACVRLCINCGLEKSAFMSPTVEKLVVAWHALPPQSQERLQRRFSTSCFSHALPTSKPVAALRDALQEILGEDAPARKQRRRKVKKGRRKGKKRAFGMRWVPKHKSEPVDEATADDPAGDDDGSDSDSMPDMQGEEVGGWSDGAFGDSSGLPQESVCQLSGVLMTDPVVAPDGSHFERAALEDWLRFSPTHPLTGSALDLASCQSADGVRLQNMQFQIGMLAEARVDQQAEEEMAAPPMPTMEPTPVVAEPTAGPALLGDLPSLAPGGASTTDAPKKKTKIRITSRKVIDAPEDMRCAIDGKICTNPMRSQYGHLFEKKTLEQWFNTCGSVCPVTEKPLKMEECFADSDMKKRIIKWLKESGHA